MNTACPNAKAANPNEENNILVIFDFLYPIPAIIVRNAAKMKLIWCITTWKKSDFTIRGIDKITIEPIIVIRKIEYFSLKTVYATFWYLFENI